MKTAEAALREKKFLDLARSAHTQIFEESGESPIEKILASVIEMDEALWTAMQPQLAEYGAIALLKALVKKTPHVVDDNPQLDLFPNMPRLITFKKRKINLLKATASELDWYGEWWGLRLEGLARRTEEDLAITGEIERLKRAMKKYDPEGTVESALRIRNERLEAAKRARECNSKPRDTVPRRQFSDFKDRTTDTSRNLEGYSKGPQGCVETHSHAG